MSRWLAMIFIVSAACAEASNDGTSGSRAGAVCSPAWYQSIEERVPTEDGQGHGPDAGSEEWKWVIEDRLGIRGKAGQPSRKSEAWCAYIDHIVRTVRTSSAETGAAGGAANAAGPSFSCDRAKAGSIEALICGDEELSALDRKLSGVYAAASRIATNEHPPMLKAEQRGWIKGRNECWKSDDKRGCVQGEYLLRIAELQARYRLVPGTGPVRFICDGNPANEVVATFFQTSPPTLIAERGDGVSLMYLQRSASGARYRGRNETLWEHQGEALITWGYGAPEMRCKKAR
jgi:uncharacterized protein